MEIKVGQVWATNLPNGTKLKVTEVKHPEFFQFPVELVDQKGSKYYATEDGYLRLVVGPNSSPFKLTILVSEADFDAPNYRERVSRQKQAREENNKRVLREYQIKRKGK